MKFKLIIDPKAPETVVATVHRKSWLTDQLQQLVLQQAGEDSLAVYDEEDVYFLPVSQIECITVAEGKTFVIDTLARRYRLKQRLYEVEARLPEYFVLINKSTVANEKRLERFSPSFGGAVDAVFRCGYRDYVSRRCLAQIKRRFEKK